MVMTREAEWASCSAPGELISGCRRAASFPYFGNHSLPNISLLKVRSQSESEGLNKFRLRPISLDALRCIPRDSLRGIAENSEGESDGSSSEGDDSPQHTPPQSPVGELPQCIIDETEVNETLKKYVRFADDCGHELYSIRVMTEASDQPPRISPSVLRKYRGSDYEEKSQAELAKIPKWKLLFTQPASQYTKFKDTLEKQKVALENVIVKQEARKFCGTIKVLNIAFEKKVFVRVTTNQWSSYMDHVAVYQKSNSKIQDNFTFEIDLPSTVDKVYRLEFCVCFMENGVEHWDSNDGQNFRIESESPEKQQEKKRTSYNRLDARAALDRDDAYRLNYTDWSKFASWKSLSTAGPYW